MKTLFQPKNILTLPLFFCLGIMGCQKTTWKQPTDLTITLDMDKTKNHPNSLSFEQGSLVLERIVITGDRKEADDIYFEKSFPQGLTVSLDSSIFVPELTFQIPQGTYTSFQVVLYSRAKTEHLFSKLQGFFKKNAHDSVAVLLNLEAQYVWRVEGVATGQELVFDTKVPMLLDVNLDAPFWFANVSHTHLNDADTEEIEDVETLLINEHKNEFIFNTIKQRIAQGVKGKSKKK